MNTNEQKSNDHSFLFQVAVHVVGSWLSPDGLPLELETLIGAGIIVQLWFLATRIAPWQKQPPPGPPDEPDPRRDGEVGG